MKLATTPKLYQRAGRRMTLYKMSKDEIKALKDDNDRLKKRLQAFIDATENLKKVAGRHHTAQAVKRLFDLLPKNA